MQTRVAGRPAAAGRAMRFGLAPLLALVLSGCGGGGGEEAAAPAETAQARAAAPAGPAAANGCKPTPPAPDSLFQGSWAAVTGWLRENHVQFPGAEGNGGVAEVQLCRGCKAVRVAIRSAAQTHCIRAADLGPAPRIAGVYVVQDSMPAVGDFGPLAAGDSLLVFATTNDAPARVAYQRGERVALAPGDAWAFHYCDDRHDFQSPRAGWRNRDSGEAVKLGEDPGGTYGWMACANGCCQFYTPPPGDDTPRPQPQPPHGPRHPRCTTVS